MTLFYLEDFLKFLYILISSYLIRKQSFAKQSNNNSPTEHNEQSLKPCIQCQNQLTYVLPVYDAKLRSEIYKITQLHDISQLHGQIVFTVV